MRTGKKLKKKSKEYKNMINNNYSNYQKDIEDEIRKTSKSNPKPFWNILKKIDKTTKGGELDLTIDEIHEYFKKLSYDNEQVEEFVLPEITENQYENILNCRISPDEIIIAIKKISNNKSCGFDNIINEYIKSSVDIMLPIYVDLFNIVLDSGIIPESWNTGVIKPIYKNKGDKKDLDNYRAITLVSCLGKVFTSILNSRLYKLSDEINLISNAHAGFRKGHSTLDNIFILHALISIYLSSGRKLYCAFIDFRKAFDSVWRIGLWRKLIKSNITGKIFKVLFNMYSNTKSCVRNGNEVTPMFTCNIGLKQGENCSPFLFALYLNDLEEFLASKNVDCLSKLHELCWDSIGIYVKMFVILYADDTVLMSETPEGLQLMLDKFQEYCENWKLTVNTQKTKLVIFSKRKHNNENRFTLYNKELEIQDTFSYLGILF